MASLAGAACTALFDRRVFSAAGLVSFAAWNLLIGVCFLLVALTPGGFAPAVPRGDRKDDRSRNPDL